MALSTNWRDLGGALYLSEKDGDDLNAGTSALPFKTIDKLMSVITSGATNYIRAGYYQLTQAYGLTATVVISGDGNVIIDGNNILVNSRLIIFKKVKLLNYISIANAVTSPSINLNDCVVEGGNIAISGTSNTLITQISGLLNFYIQTQSSIDYIVSRSTFNSIVNLTGRINQFITFINCVYTENATITPTNNSFTFQNCALSNNTIFDGVNFGTLTLNGDGANIETTYTDGVKFSGTYEDGLLVVSFIDCFWTANFGFNDVIIKDYTLKESPRSILYNQNNIIGAYNVAYRNLPSLGGWDAGNGAIYTDINRNTVDEKFELINPAVVGTCQSSLTPTLALNLGGLRTINNPVLIFGELAPLEVVQKTKYNAVDPSPVVRRIVEYKIYDESEPNGVDNILNWLPQDANTWYEMEGSMPLELDVTMKGNGNIDADMTNLGAVTMNRYAQKITIRKDGN